MTKDRFYIEDAGKHDGQIVTVRGWVYNKRSSGKIKFLILRDGTGLLQGVLFKGECTEEAFGEFEKLTQESSIEVIGKLRKEPRSPGGFELGVQSIKIVQVADPYPISLKEHGVEFLMEKRHLWLRSQRQWAALRVRSEIMRSIQEFFDDRGFVRFDAPILTPSSCEGTSTLFSTPYFDEKAFLTQSGQLYGEVGAMAFGKVYVFGPTFRAEKSKTRKHLTEFWMVEPEVAFADLEDNMLMGEQFIEHIVQSVLSRKAPELKILERDLTELENIKGPFPRISYDEALKILEKRGIALPWGEDFGAPHETALGEEFGKPVFVHHMPSDIKAFYFKQSDTVGGPAVSGTGKYALGCDLIAPKGYGEIIGGGQREESAEVLQRRIAEHGLSEADYSWYLDLRRFGSVPHSGFGLGVERTVAWMTGVEHVRETIPFPRMLNTLRP
ncbi:MAG TPA: asparagine--tRNA ligase [Bdellovibrionales bacterium]|nr:MAG: asparagine--tRNA ligase [Bdellovibrionales bacterium GWB1_52_6]OFZ05786.1 MAG: asparagine--tRNA ligase [Bdellovibrionales bacterium GWA1_52_35]OFZ43686.1 MAG: asparagine--tRNA ligase [Bdellovibrionales bacterium GWC1_52_8]HAR42200.1 asparagine--tRNA ligase [Bdellovibrionales bacterium]HCM40273.1 asparagine--tRNA ligase [Bdellovibrionales bacterium]